MKAQYAIATIALATVSMAAVAGPDCTSADKAQWMSEGAMKQQIEADGYSIDKFKTTTGNCYEIYGRDKAGKKVEIYFNPVDGSIVKERRKS